ncbi:MAG: ADP-ribosylglycohydrolase family protein [Opitutales bacterium]|jgi:ADP-ribosylglycohydrolase
MDQATESLFTKFYGAWWAAFIGDALAMPGHGYYTRPSLKRDYPSFATYQAPHYPHPDSTLFRTRYEFKSPRGDILHDRAAAWKKPGTHFHHQLQAGENTLILQITRELADTIAVHGRFDAADYTQRFIDFMLTPGRHRDTYVPENIREFFHRYDSGRDPAHCGVDSLHMAGLCLTLPLMLFYFRRRQEGLKAIREVLHLTHRGEPIALASELLFDILAHLLQGWPIGATIFEKIGRDRHPALAYPFRRWLDAKRSAEDLIAHDLNTGAHIENAFPLVIYLALKHANDIEGGLTANAALGGDSAHRGAVLGALLGAANGCENIPDLWVEGLYFRPQIESTVENLWAAAKFEAQT